MLGVKPAHIPDFRAPKAVPVSVCRAGGGEVRRRWPRSGSAASSTSFGLTHAPSHKQTDAVQVDGQYRQCNGVCKITGAVGAHPVETAMLKVVDCRLDRRVLAPSPTLSRLFVLDNTRALTPLLGKSVAEGGDRHAFVAPPHDLVSGRGVMLAVLIAAENGDEKHRGAEVLRRRQVGVGAIIGEEPQLDVGEHEVGGALWNFASEQGHQHHTPALTALMVMALRHRPGDIVQAIEPALRLFVPVIRLLSRRRAALGDGVVPVARYAGAIAARSAAYWTIRDHRAILHSEPYASADLGAASDVTAKSVQSEAASASSSTPISLQLTSDVIAGTQGARLLWQAASAQGGNNDTSQAGAVGRFSAGSLRPAQSVHEGCSPNTRAFSQPPTLCPAGNSAPTSSVNYAVCWVGGA